MNRVRRYSLGLKYPGLATNFHRLTSLRGTLWYVKPPTPLRAASLPAVRVARVLPVPCSEGSARGSVLQGVFHARPFSFVAVNPGAMRAQTGPVQMKTAIQRHPGVDAFQVDLRPKSGGWPLPRDVQAKMEAALGANFSDVRVHVGPEASAIGAIAFTWARTCISHPANTIPIRRTASSCSATSSRTWCSSAPAASPTPSAAGSR